MTDFKCFNSNIFNIDKIIKVSKGYSLIFTF